MIPFAMLLVSAAAGPLQVLESPAFETFVQRADAVCPARQFRYISPADLDLQQEDFEAKLEPRTRKRLAAANDADRRCAGHNGLSCSATATLEAYAKVRLMTSFAAFACANGVAK